MVLWRVREACCAACVCAPQPTPHRMHAAPCARNVHRRGSPREPRRMPQTHARFAGSGCRAAHVGTRAQGRAQATSCRLSLCEASTSSATDAPTRSSPCTGRFVHALLKSTPCEYSGRAKEELLRTPQWRTLALCVFAFSGPSSFPHIGGRDAPAGPAAHGVSVPLLRPLSHLAHPDLTHFPT